jgi:DME family drug/metabolite transporter
LTVVVVALSSALLWAIASVLFALSIKSLHVLPLNLVRSVVATAFFWAILPFYGGISALRAIPTSAWLWLVVSVLGLLVVGDMLYFRAIDLAGVSWAMPVASINTVWAVLLAGLALHEPLTKPLLGGALLVLVGVILVGRSAPSVASAHMSDGRARKIGLLLALAASISWGIGQVALKPGAAGIEAAVANSVRQPLGLLMMLGLNLSTGRWRDLRGLDGRSWWVLLLASLLGTAIGSLLFVMAVQMAGAGRAAVLTTTAPVMAIPFSYLWLHERPNRWTIAGTLLVTAGIALVA